MWTRQSSRTNRAGIRGGAKRSYVGTVRRKKQNKGCKVMGNKILAKLRMPDGSINPWVIAVTVTLATFMEVLDTSIANVALPHIAGNLSVATDESTWVLTSYLVSNAIILPLSG